MAVSRPRLAVMSITEGAADRIREIVASHDPPLAGVRVGVKNAGCAGMSYTLDPVHDLKPGDDLVQEHGVDVYVDPKAVMFLLGSVMDHETSKFRSGFVFRNPNEVSSCGCGESVMLKPAEGVPA